MPNEYPTWKRAVVKDRYGATADWTTIPNPTAWICYFPDGTVRTWPHEPPADMGYLAERIEMVRRDPGAEESGS
jgi:hypothetical protein